MVIRNGKCYPDKPTPLLKITSVENLGAYRLKVAFNDSEERIFDGHLLLDGEVFAPLRDENVFNAYELDYETLTWNNGEIDVAPEYVYEHSLAT